MHPRLIHQPRDVLYPMDVGVDGPHAPPHGREVFSGEKRDPVPSEKQIVEASFTDSSSFTPTPIVLPGTISQTHSLYPNSRLRLGLGRLGKLCCASHPMTKGEGDETYM